MIGGNDSVTVLFVSNSILHGGPTARPTLRPSAPLTLRPSQAGVSRSAGNGTYDALLKSLIAVVVVSVLSLAFYTGNMPTFVPEWAGSITARFMALFGGLALFHFASCIVHALRYQPHPTPSDRDLPTCTVIVPAYNEGEMVRVALRSALHSNYPKDKLRVIAIDDGSKDDTWAHIQAVAAAFPGRVIAIKQPKNGGKRAALLRGFAEVESEVVVTVDSDSRLEPDALRGIVAPFARPEVGAVAGKVMVLNRYDNFLTRCMSARFFVTFDLMRAAQSRFGAVLCTPGALSAYRMSALRPVLDQWASQTFLGTPCTIAEDRALTTWLLRTGWRSVYQSSAIVRTLMPTRFDRMVRMMLRWERGNVRENLVLIPVLPRLWADSSGTPGSAPAVRGQRAFRSIDRWWPAMEVFLDLVGHPLALISLVIAFSHVTVLHVWLLRVFAGIALFTLVQSLYSLRTERRTDFLYGVAFGFMYFVALQWIVPYSCLTVRNGRWLTR